MAEDKKYLRRKRSKETITAITYQMEYVIKEYPVEVMVLSDSQGLLIASYGHDELSELIAAFGHRLAAGEPPDPSLFELMPDLKAEMILSEPIELDEIPLFLTAIMAPEEEAARGFARARKGIKRIYNTT